MVLTKWEYEDGDGDSEEPDKTAREQLQQRFKNRGLNHFFGMHENIH